ncbi:helix-turn-helix transcriptional regulator [Rhizobium sp. SSA_523]|uniref:helix-turn-helix transcriptional regulator n=2 Tax=Rhizobium sp. SSA_523 TaxID=2952477 RepID=UPI00339D8702
MAVMEKLPAQFGFKAFSLMTVPAPTDRSLGAIMVKTTLPRRFISEFDAHNLLTQCPLSSMMKSMALPLGWRCDRSPRREAGLAFPDPQVRLMEAFGLPAGAAMTLHSSSNAAYIMRLDGERSLLTLPELNELGMLFLQAFRVFDRLQQAEKTPHARLTCRELEVLRWTSQGKTSSEIAEILSLSEYTVTAYLNKAIKKLDCVNRTQLVAKAIRLQLIT